MDRGRSGRRLDAALIPLRAELAGGDLRALYVVWLACARAGWLDDVVVEPPVPPGLGQPSAALSALAAFLRVGEDLLAAAVKRSAALSEATPATGDLERWIRDLPAPEKDALLLRAAAGGGAYLQMELQRRVREAAIPTAPAAPRQHAPSGGRTVADLLAAADERERDRTRAGAARAARERARHEKGQSAAPRTSTARRGARRRCGARQSR